ncbi:lyase family protein [Thiomonas sp. FB-6]|uniref:lyase family protein n=1 Tax=Thiomonas sp. FB-6 TaxID=1158291 RepID=UPI000377321E|nr:lyase family protein [Thiomonas sp. FB-6]
MFEHRDTLDPCGVRAKIEHIFSERATVARVLQFEAVIAAAQARNGLIPREAAEEIQIRAHEHMVPAEAVQRRLLDAGHPMVAILDAWAECLSPAAAEWIHFGATTADVLRTVQGMQLHDVVDALEPAMRSVESMLAALAIRHRATPMIGRTLGRHALPITFGFKVAVWLAENRRNLDRLRAWRVGASCGVFSGAVGTYSILGSHGPRVEVEVLRELGLGSPEVIDPKGSFDRYAEFASILAIAAKSYGRIAQEVFLLQGDDIRELGESSSAVGSSTMPHKSNPTLSIEVLSRSREVGAMLDVILDWMLVVHERDSAHHDGTLTRMCIDFGQLLSCMCALLGRLQIFPQNMLRNIGRTHGMVFAEALTQRLAPLIGRRTAHSRLHALAVEAAERGQDLFDAVAQDPHLGPLLGEDIRATVTADQGETARTVDRVLANLGLEQAEAPGHDQSA